MKTVLLLGGPAAGQRVEVHGAMTSYRALTGACGFPVETIYRITPMCSHGEVHWFGVLDGADPLALLIAGYAAAPKDFTEDVLRIKNSDRFRKLHSHLCGYVENGGGEPISICQDDATREWSVRVGFVQPINTSRWYGGSSMAEAIDAAILGEGDKS